ncbi:MAG: hypothetical protein JKY65_03090 [Planctomycetes bacterium]|nr:hypothetical protein [Planctomycetota bacterium]
MALRPLCSLLLLWLALGFGLGGCAATPLPTLGPLPEGGQAGELWVTPMARGYVPTLEEPRDDQNRLPLFSPPYRIAVEARPIRELVLNDLRERGGFKRVESLEAPSRALPSELLRAARAAGAELLLEVSLDDATVRFLGTNSLHGFKIAILIVSSIMIFPAADPLNWFLPSEEYGVTLDATWRLTDVKSGRQLGQGYLESTASGSFAAFGFGYTRPWYLIGFLRTPSCIDEEEWEGIGAQLVERAKVQLEVDLVRAVEAARFAKEPAPPR